MVSDSSPLLVVLCACRRDLGLAAVFPIEERSECELDDEVELNSSPLEELNDTALISEFDTTRRGCALTYCVSFIAVVVPCPSELLFRCTR